MVVNGRRWSVNKVAHCVGRNDGGQDGHGGKVARVNAAFREQVHLVGEIGDLVLVRALNHVPVVAHLPGYAHYATEQTLWAVFDYELVLRQNGLAQRVVGVLEGLLHFERSVRTLYSEILNISYSVVGKITETCNQNG